MYVLFQKIWTMPLSWEVFYFELPHPYGSSHLAPYCPSKIFAFNPPPPPHPLGISIHLPWDGHGYFLELHYTQ